MRPHRLSATSRAIKAVLLLLAPVALTLNFFFLHSLIIGIILSILWFGVSCMLWGNVFAPSHEWFERHTLGFLSVLVLVILAGTACFRLAVFNQYVIFAITFFIPLAGFVVLFLRSKRQPPADIKPEINQTLPRLPLKKYFVSALLTFAYLVLFALSINLILNHRTDASIRSPWEVLPHSLLYLYALATFILYFIFSLHYKQGLIVKKNVSASNSPAKVSVGENPPQFAPAWFRLIGGWCERGGAHPAAGRDDACFSNAQPSTACFSTTFFSSIKLILLLFHFFFTISLALLVYRIGYGFDPFIHRATEKIIFETGSLTPPPFSYLGQYVLVVFLSKVTLIPLPLINLWLLPALASILIPIIGIFTLKKYFQKTHFLPITILSLLIIPPSFFIATVPQSLANLFYFILVLLSLSYLHQRVPLSFLWGIAFCILFIHPITGIPAFIFLSSLSITTYQPQVAAFRREDCLSERSERIPQQEKRQLRRRNQVRPFSIIIITIIGALGLPAAIMVANRLYGGAAPVSSDTLPLPNLIPHYLPFLSLAHTGELWMRAMPLFFLVGALTGTYLLMRRKHQTFPLIAWLTASVLFINYIFIRKLPLTAMISYERPEFTERILELIAITLLPLFVIALHRIIFLFFSLSIFPSLLVLTSLITISFYYTYPRVDAFAKSRAYSVSQSDIDTAHWIKNDARDEQYIVLSNQSVSAAALQEFGFKKYFKFKNCQTADCQTIFYYPVPTSSPLYQYYLDMVYREASRMTMENAMDLVGVRRAYFVLNSYWLDAEKIALRASLDADRKAAVGSTKVFVYLKK